MKDHFGVDESKLARLGQKWQTALGVSLPVRLLPLQDCVDISTFLVNLTAVVQRWTVGIRGVGGAVDVATVTRFVGYEDIKKKTIHARSIGI